MHGAHDVIHEQQRPTDTWCTTPVRCAAVSPEALAPELGQLKDEVRRMQAFLGVGPAAGGPLQAGAAPEPARAATVPEPLRAAEPWGAPGREPRQPGEMPRNMGEQLQPVPSSQTAVMSCMTAWGFG